MDSKRVQEIKDLSKGFYQGMLAAKDKRVASGLKIVCKALDECTMAIEFLTAEKTALEKLFTRVNAPCEKCQTKYSIPIATSLVTATILCKCPTCKHEMTVNFAVDPNDKSKGHFGIPSKK